MTQPRALVGNSGDTQQIRQARKAEQGRREREVRDMRQVLDTPHGKRVLWRMLERCGMYKTSAVHDNPYATYYNEGERNIGLFLHAEIEEASPQAILDMVLLARADRDVEKAEAVADNEPSQDDDDGD